MKVIYVALDPSKSARVRKIAYSIRKCGGAEFNVMFPKIRLVWRGGMISRLFAAIINYLAVVLQIMFVKADVFWVANCPDILALPVVLMRRYYILEYRSPWSLQVKQEFGGGLLVKLSAIIESIALKYAEVITLTTSKLIVRVKGYGGKPVFVIPNFPSKTFRVTVCREEFRKRHHGHSDEKVVLFVGRLSRVEGADMLCDIATKVLETVDAVFWIVGDGPFYPLLERSGKKFSDRFRLFGWRPHSEIANFINAADVCIVPRHKVPYSFIYNEEGVSKISEYMFFGKPIVACGIAESDQYLLVDEKEMAEGIMKALKGEVSPSSTRRTWEDYSEKNICDMFSLIQSGRI